MKKYNNFILALIFAVFLPSLVQATSLDELYRDVVKSDNEGYLPMFVKNRRVPDVFSEEDVLKKLPEQKVEQENTTIKEAKPINLINERKIREEEKKKALLKWQNTIEAVQQNRVTPVELEEINNHIEKNDPRAIEIFAWMNARGVGVPVNLADAFHLYQRAATLNVPKAAENAALVYKAMTKQQRESLTNQ